jgi:branched-chain amino acid transport system permease protein
MAGKSLAAFAFAVIAVALLLALPQFASRYTVSLATSILSYVILSTAWAMFSGPTRYVSLATSSFYGIGAYATAIAIGSVPLPAVLLIAAIAAAILAVVVGFSTLRLSGMYFVIFTFGLTELIRQLTTWFQINVTRTRVLYIFAKFGDYELYYYLVGLCALTLLVSLIVRRSRLGVALRVVGEDETLAQHTGINTTLTKLSVFAVSGMLISMTGAVMAPRWTYIDPNIAFNSLISIQVVIMALLGGIGRLYGPAIGAVPLVLLSEYLAGRFPYHFSIALGLCFVAIVYILPQGLAGLLEGFMGRLRLIAAVRPMVR